MVSKTDPGWLVVRVSKVCVVGRVLVLILALGMVENGVIRGLLPIG